MAHVLVIGSANMDVVTPVRRLPAPGETLLIDDIRLVSGGEGANAAVAAVRLGAEVRFVGCVGNDSFGRSIRESLLAEGIDCGQLQQVECGTDTAIILLNQDDGQNAIMVGPGANHKITLPVDDEIFAWADILMLHLETPIAINIEASKRARAQGVRVVLDPAPAVDNLPDELLCLADIVSPNESEISILSGQRVESVEDAIAAARELIERGVQQLVVKLGEQGLCGSQKKLTSTLWLFQSSRWTPPQRETHSPPRCALLLWKT